MSLPLGLRVRIKLSRPFSQWDGMEGTSIHPKGNYNIQAGMTAIEFDTPVVFHMNITWVFWSDKELEVVRARSSLEENIASYIAAEKKELGLT